MLECPDAWSLLGSGFVWVFLSALSVSTVCSRRVAYSCVPNINIVITEQGLAGKMVKRNAEAALLIG